MNWFTRILRTIGLEKGLLSIAGANGIAAIVGAIFWLYVATLLSPDNYGEVNYFLSIAFLFGSVSTLGLGITVTTFIPKKKEEIIHQANLLVFISSSLVAIGLLFFVGSFPTIIMLFGMSFFAMSIAEFLGRQDYRGFSFVIISQRVLNIPLCLVLYYLIGLEGFIIGYGFSTLLFSYNFFKSFRGFKLTFKDLRPIYHFIIHSYFVDVSNSVTRHFDKLLIGILFGFGVLGLYQIGFQFLIFLSIIPTSLFQFLLPREAAGIQSGNVIIKGLSIAVAFSLVSFTVIPSIISNLFPNFIESIEASQVMAFGIVPMTVNAILSSKLFGKERSKPILIATIIMIVSLSILIPLLGSMLGLMGLAFSVVASLSIQCISLFIMYRILHTRTSK